MSCQYLRIGYVLRPQGIKGEVKLEALTDDISRFNDLQRVYVEQNGSYKEVKITVNRIYGNNVYVYLEGYYTREAAESLRNAYICVNRSDSIKLPENSWFICDIEGIKVECAGEELGIIDEVIKTGAVDVFSVKKIGGGNLLFPALKKVIISVDLEKGIMELDKSALDEVSVHED